MEKITPRKSATCGTKLEDVVRLGSEQSSTCEHCQFVRCPNLSRRANYLLRFLQNYLTAECLRHLQAEFASESRRDQNVLADTLFASLLEVSDFRLPTDTRLSVKIIAMAGDILEQVAPYKLRDYFD